MVEIERISIQKQCDTLNKIKLLTARQEVGETIRGFVRRLAYACDFTAKCMSKSCTEANTEMIILPVLVRGMDDVHTQAELLVEVELPTPTQCSKLTKRTPKTAPTRRCRTSRTQMP